MSYYDIIGLHNRSISFHVKFDRVLVISHNLMIMCIFAFVCAYVVCVCVCLHYKRYRWLRIRRTLMLCNNVPFRTRRMLLPYTLYIDSALLVLIGKSLNSDNSLLTVNRLLQYGPKQHNWIVITPFWLSTDDITIWAKTAVLYDKYSKNSWVKH